MAKATDDTTRALSVAVLTVSDTRTEETDTSGKILVEKLTEAGHTLSDKKIVIDDKYKLRATVSNWIADDVTQVILVTGGTGFTERDSTPDAITPLLDREIPGFGELFRQISFQQIGTSTIQSRACAGVAGGTYLFALPGSPGACRDGWDGILIHQLDYRHMPCNFVEIMPRLEEHKRRK